VVGWHTDVFCCRRRFCKKLVMFVFSRLLALAVGMYQITLHYITDF